MVIFGPKNKEQVQRGRVQPPEPPVPEEVEREIGEGGVGEGVVGEGRAGEFEPPERQPAQFDGAPEVSLREPDNLENWREITFGSFNFWVKEENEEVENE